MSAALEVRLTGRDPRGAVVCRLRLCWPVPPTARDVLAVLCDQVCAARRAHVVLVVDGAPDWVSPLLRLAGLAAPEGPIGIG